MSELTHLLPTTVREDDTLDIGWRWEAGEIDNMEALCLLLNTSKIYSELFIDSTEVPGEGALKRLSMVIAQEWDARFFKEHGVYPRV